MTNQELAEYNKHRKMYQFCCITGDIEKTMQAWVDILKVGPWQVRHFNDKTMSSLTVGGKKITEPFEMIIAISKVGDMEIELIQPVHGPTIYQEFLDRRGPGLFHVKEKIATEDWDATVKEFADKGVGILQTGWFFDDVHAYMDTEPTCDFIWELGNCPVIDVPEGMTRIFPYNND